MSEQFSEDDILDGEPGVEEMVYSLAAEPGVTPGQAGWVFAATSSGMRRSEDGGQTWQDALESLQLTQALPVTALALSPDYTKDGCVFGGAPGGFFLSTSGGMSWRALILPNPPPTVTALAVSPAFDYDSTLFAGTMEDGVFVSTEGGSRWVAWNFGLLDLNVMCLAISPAFSADETIFAGVESGVFRSENGGRAWREIELPFGYDAVLSLVLSPDYTKNRTLFAGTEEQGLWVSTDAGETWSQLASDQIEDPVNSLLAGPGGSLLAVTGAALWRTLDGSAWEDCLPEEYAGREISAVAAPKGFARGATILAAFTDGSIEPVRLL